MSDVITKPKVKVDSAIKTLAKEQAYLEQQVIVHCKIITPSTMAMGIRIWPSTYLLDNDSDHQSKLLHNENIPLMPGWKSIPAGVEYVFTLIFAGLPKACTKFHLVELIPQSGGFEVLNIARNNTDIYHVTL